MARLPFVAALCLMAGFGNGTNATTPNDTTTDTTTTSAKPTTTTTTTVTTTIFTNTTTMTTSTTAAAAEHCTRPQAKDLPVCKSNGGKDPALWEVGEVTDLSAVFMWDNTFNGDLSEWKTGAVTSLRDTFNGGIFNRAIGEWDVHSVIDMRYTFAYNLVFNQNIANWQTASLEDMFQTFDGASSFNSDISAWQVSGVTDMRGAFKGAAALSSCTKVKLVDAPVWKINAAFTKELEAEFTKSKSASKCPAVEQPKCSELTDQKEFAKGGSWLVKGTCATCSNLDCGKKQRIGNCSGYTDGFECTQITKDEVVEEEEKKQQSQFFVFLYTACPITILAVIMGYRVALVCWAEESIRKLPFKAHWWVWMGVGAKLLDVQSDVASFFINLGMIGDTDNLFYELSDSKGDADSVDTIRLIALVSWIVGALLWFPDVRGGLSLKAGGSPGSLWCAKFWGVASLLFEDFPQMTLAVLYAETTDMDWSAFKNDQNVQMTYVSLLLSLVTILDRLHLVFCLSVNNPTIERERTYTTEKRDALEEKKEKKRQTTRRKKKPTHETEFPSGTPTQAAEPQPRDRVMTLRRESEALDYEIGI